MSIATRCSKSLWSYNPIPGGCVLYLPLWSPGLSGPVFKSIDPYGHTCTVTGATWAPEGYDFVAASSQKLTVTHATSLQPGANNFTLILWFEPDNVTGGSIGLVNKGGNVEGWDIRMRANGANVQVQLNDGTDRDTPEIVLGAAFVVNTAYCLGVGVDRTNDKVYLFKNGVKEANEGALTVTDPVAGTNNILIGADYDGNYLDGTFGELAYYPTRLLTTAEHLHYYNKTKFRYT